MYVVSHEMILEQEQRHTYFSSIQLDHMEIKSSQNSIGRSFTDFSSPIWGILPSMIDAKDSLGEEGNACLPNSSTVRRQSFLGR